ncbi:Cyclin-dependent kinase 14 [Lachnellula arida]|uniref:Cyclin-dependent kinase 14 n=1 Tax=Lachnellula arida TaxID=1316785 RepID=A0A8T9B954_9HELO|nr:Cyclin-dependent kinase 14 [Lachnellula arida]
MAVHGGTTLCYNKPLEERVYFRKDKFRQHCDKSHPSIDTTDYVERAYFRVDCDVPSYCGFCRETKNFTTRQNRFDHIASHFEGGRDMTQWNQPLPQAFEDEEEDVNDDDDHNGSSNDEDSDHDDGDKDVNYGDGNDSQGNYRNSSGHNNGKPSFQDGPNDSGYNSKGSGQSSANNTASRLVFEHISGLNSNEGWPKSIAQSEHTVNEMVEPERESPERQLDLPSINDKQFFAGSKNLVFKRSSFKTVMRDYFRRTKKGPSTIEGVLTKIAHRRQHSQTSTNLQNVTDGPLPKAGSPQVTNIAFTENNACKKMDSLSLWTTKDPQSSSVASSATLAAVPLEQEILNALIPQPGHRFFFPESCLDALITEEAIERELLGALPSLFAILVYLRKEKLIQKFADEQITDSNLPFNLALDFLKGEIRGTLSKVFAGWPPHDINEFYHIQWSFSAPVFDQLHKHYEMDEHVIMPFVESEEDNARQGGYSEVWRVRIHPAHQRLLPPINGEQPSFAVKRLSSNDPGEFGREVEMLNAFSDRKHAHLVQLLATYKFRERYHLIFPYAKSNLREFWNSFPLVENPKMTASWALKQVRGIASGLSRIHFPGPRTSEFNSVSSSSLPSINSDIRERRFGRHGDIKPENILWFDKEGISGGVLVLSDMGLSRFHRIESRFNVGPQTIGGTGTYVPPEVELGGAVSRAYDIWSLGCLLLEFITWIVDGAQGLDAFGDLRIEETADGIYDDSFYTVTQKPPPRAIIRKGVREWIEHLRGQPQCSKFLLDFLGLILGRLLTTEPKDRISSDELDRKLSKILQRVQTDPHYSEPFNKPKRLSLPLSGDQRIPSILNIEFLGEGSELKKESGHRSEQEETSQGENSNEEEEGASQVDDPDNSQDQNQDNGSNKTSRRSPMSTS